MIEAIITDITSLNRATDVCIAAIADGRQIRLDDPRPNEEWVARVGGLRPGSVIRTEWRPASHSRPPHNEDGRWSMNAFSKVDELSEDDLVDLLEESAYDSVRQAFGEPVAIGTGGSAGFPPGRGSHSLVSIRVSHFALTPPWDQATEKVRVAFRDTRDEWRRVPLQDLGINQHRTNCRGCARRFRELLRSDFPASEALLRVGLAREQVLGTHPNACWLQVNHVLRKAPRKRHFL